MASTAETSVESLQDNAYRFIRRRIVYMEYLPGEKLSFKRLMEDLQIGRTPVRESLVRLQQEGLVNTVPQSGTYVSRISLATAQSARFVREELERAVAMECCCRASIVDVDAIDRALDLQRRAAATHDEGDFFISDDLMHRALFDIAGRSEVWSWLSTSNTDLERYRRLRVATEGLAWDSIMDEHQRIREAIVRRDPMEVRYLISKHLRMMLADQARVVAAYPDYFTEDSPALAGVPGSAS